MFEFAEQASAEYAGWPTRAVRPAPRRASINSTRCSPSLTRMRTGWVSPSPATDAPAYLILAGVPGVDQNEAESLAALALELVTETRR
ncbi:MAG: hypothetical protein ACRENP_08060 [Longimicrobiales bacterium]